MQVKRMLCGLPFGQREVKMFFENDNSGLCFKHGWIGYADNNGDYWCSQYRWVGNMFSTRDYYGKLHSRESYDDGNLMDFSDDD